MAGSKKIYSCSFFGSIAGPGSASRTFEINSANREMKIKSVLIDIELTNNATGVRTDFQNYPGLLQVAFGNALSQISLPFSNFSTPPDYNGNLFYLLRPGQVNFDSWYVKNVLPCLFFISNTGVFVVNYVATLIVETEEKIIY